MVGVARYTGGKTASDKLEKDRRTINNNGLSVFAVSLHYNEEVKSVLNGTSREGFKLRSAK